MTNPYLIQIGSAVILTPLIIALLILQIKISQRLTKVETILNLLIKKIPPTISMN